MALKKLGGLIPRHLQSSGLAKGVLSARVIELANSVLDELYGAGSSEQTVRAVALKRGKLQIASMHSTFRQEVHDSADLIREKVNSKVGEPLVKDIQVIV